MTSTMDALIKMIASGQMPKPELRDIGLFCEDNWMLPGELESCFAIWIAIFATSLIFYLSSVSSKIN
jgi:hypothetical protein